MAWFSNVQFVMERDDFIEYFSCSFSNNQVLKINNAIGGLNFTSARMKSGFIFLPNMLTASDAINKL